MVKRVWQTDGRTDRQTDGQTDWTSHIAAWSQQKNPFTYLWRRLQCWLLKDIYIKVDARSTNHAPIVNFWRAFLKQSEFSGMEYSGGLSRPPDVYKHQKKTIRIHIRYSLLCGKTIFICRLLKMVKNNLVIIYSFFNVIDKLHVEIFFENRKTGVRQTLSAEWHCKCTIHAVHGAFGNTD